MTTMEEPTARSSQSASQLQREIERCHQEIDQVERLLRAGHPDVEGLCLALSDWSGELRILENKLAAERKRNAAD